MLTNKFTYIIGIPIGLLGAGIPFAIWGISYSFGYIDFPYYIIHAAIAFIYYMVGLLISDISEVIYKRKNDIILQDSVPSEVHIAFMNKKAPWLLGSFIVLLTLGVLALIFVFSHKWPLLP